MTSLKRRRLDVIFKIGEGAFGEGGTDTVKVSGARVIARISKAGGMSMSQAQIDIYGMPQDRMNRLSTLGMRITATRKNEITLDAGNEGDAMATVFSGTFVDAYADYQGIPEVPFRVIARAGQFDTVKPAPPTSYQGSVDVATVLSGLASKAGWSFENNGVKKMLSNPYYSGSIRQQILAAVNDAGIEHIIDNLTLAIWNPGQSRGGQAVVLSSSTILAGFPVFSSKGIIVRGLYDPSISFGTRIFLPDTSIKDAQGEWVIKKLDYELDSEVPNGSWFFNAEALRPGSEAVYR